jgi:DNA-nicking Smr family endonuclease
LSDRPKDKSRQNPFKSLKGFCASPPKKPQKVAPEKPEKGPESEEDDATVFAREMNRLGLSAPEQDSRLPEDGKPRPVTERKSPPPSDRDLFLAALGQMETTFSDEFPAEEEVRAEPRRMRQLRKGKILPEAQLDLHGLSRAEARQKVRYFLENARHHGLRTVLLVTGRGKSSGSEPVIRKDVELYLESEGKAFLSEWGRAPRQFGGDGALVVFLKGEK